MLVKVHRYKLAQRGKSGYSLSIPSVWVEDNDLQPGDVINVFRDANNRLVLQIEKKSKKSTKNRQKSEKSC